MSTRLTLWYNDDFHLYQEGFDEQNVYLEVKTSHLEEFVLRIPLAAWKEMRKQTIEPAERYSDLTDEEMLAEAERAVDEHRKRLEGLPDTKVKSFVGGLVFGKPGSTRSEMIKSFLHFHRRQMAKGYEQPSPLDQI